MAGQNIGDKSVTLLNKHSAFVYYMNEFYPSSVINIGKSFPTHHGSIGKDSSETDFTIEYEKKKHYPKSEAQFVAYVHKEEVFPEHGVRTKVVDIAAKFLFRNRTRSVLVFGQSGCPKGKLTTCPGEEAPFFWHDKEGTRTTQVALPESLASEEFRVDEVGPIVQELVRTADGRTAGIIRIERVKHKGSYYIEVYSELTERPQYLIYNSCENVAVAYKQAGTEVDFKYLDANSTVPFGWANPSLKHSVVLKFCWGKFKEHPLEFPDSLHDFSMDEVKQEELITLPLTKRRGKNVWVSLEYDGHSRILKIGDTRKHDLTQTGITTRLVVDLAGIGVSLITTQEERRMELLYLTLSHLLLRTSELDGRKDLYFALQKLQIDNQTRDSPVFPVVLYTTASVRKDSDSAAVAEEESFFQLGFVMDELTDTQSRFYSFDFVKAAVTTIVIRLEIDFIMALQEFITFVRQNTKLEIDTKVFGTREDFISRRDPAETEATVHINDFDMQKVNIRVSYKQSLGNYTKRKQNTVLKALAAAFLNNVEELPIVLDRIYVKNIHYKIMELAIGVAEIYQDCLMQQKIAIVASLLFSHIRDIRYIGAGLADMLRRGSGTSARGGFVKNAIVGTFGTASRLTATASKSMLALTNDEDYIIAVQDEEEKLRPKHVLEGVGLGAYSAIRSVASALYGVVSKPVEGAMQDGVGGFFKGTLQGLTGVIVKPISGGLDLISKTAEGVKNTAELFGEQKQKAVMQERERRPRPFYTSQNLVHPPQR